MRAWGGGWLHSEVSGPVLVVSFLKMLWALLGIRALSEPSTLFRNPWAGCPLMVSGGNTADLSSGRAGTWGRWASGKEGPSSGERRAWWRNEHFPLLSPGCPLGSKAPDMPIPCALCGLRPSLMGPVVGNRPG